MRRLPWFAPSLMTAAFALIFPVAGRSAAQAQSATAPSDNASASSAPPNAAAPPQQDSLADAARKAKEKKKAAASSAKVFTNDNLPTQARISSVGTAAEPAADSSAAAAPGNSGVAKDEKVWRDKFAGLRHTLDQDQSALDVMQRELGESSTQFYGGDPNAAFQDQRSQQPLGSAHAKKVDEIDAKKKQVDADQQALDDAEDELRKSGGDPGWAR